MKITTIGTDKVLSLWSPHTKTIILLLCAILASAAGTGYLFYDYNQEKNRFKFVHIRYTKQILRQATESFQNHINTATQLAQLTADNLTTGKITHEQAIDQLKTFITKQNIVVSAGISYEPFTYNQSKKLFSPQFFTPNGNLRPIATETFYDYTKSTWYALSRRGKPHWTEPYLEPSLNTLIIRFVVPFYYFDVNTQSRRQKGAITLDLGLEQLQHVVESLNLDRDSYAFMISNNGTLLAYPTYEEVETQKTIFDLGRMPGKKEFLPLAETIVDGGIGSASFYDTLAKQTYQVFFQSLRATGWSLVIISAEQRTVLISKSLHRKLIHCALALVLFLFLFSMLLTRAYRGNMFSLWTLSALFSLLLTGVIGYIWTLDLLTPPSMGKNTEIIQNKAELERFLYLHKKLNPLLYKTDPPIIPTGLYLYSLGIGDGSTISINGFLWQKYYDIQLNMVSPGFTLINAKNANNLEFSMPAYKKNNEGITTLGWRMEAMVAGRFVVDKYPFDQQNITLYLSHKDIDKNIILTPDFASFTPTNNPYPELDKLITTGQWFAQSTNFFYSMSNLLTDFGIENYFKQKNFPVLCFNINIRRKFFSPLIATIIPILIIMFIIFTNLLSVSITKEDKDQTINVLRLSSGIFFATAVAHQTFKSVVRTASITYIEYYYFVLYIIILVVTINSLLYTRKTPFKLILYRKNLIPKLLYWPSLLSVFMGLTLWFFY